MSIENTRDRSDRIDRLDPAIAESMAVDVLTSAIDVLIDVQDMEDWLDDADTQLSIELSVSDWFRVFTTMTAQAAQDRHTLPRMSLDAALIAQHVAAELAVAKRPVTV